MIVKIVDKYKEGEHGVWLDPEKVPAKVLLEIDDGNGQPSGKPAIKINSIFFYFGQPTEGVHKYRVLALQSIVVCIQQ
jgi:hypothetical protein